MLAAYRQTGELPEDLANAPKCPDNAVHIWNSFLELHRARGSNGFGPSCLTYSDIEAWGRLTRQSLDLWELDALLRLDGVYLAAYAKQKKADT